MVPHNTCGSTCRSVHTYLYVFMYIRIHLTEVARVYKPSPQNEELALHFLGSASVPLHPIPA